MASRTTMEFTEAVRIAAASLWAHKLRSVLTLLGVVVAVTSVIAVVSFINGANSYVAERVFNLGADVFVMQKGSGIVTNIDEFIKIQKRKNLALDDYEALRDGCKNCMAVGATVGRRIEVRYGTNSIVDSSLRGVTPSFQVINDLDLTAGRFVSESDLRSAAPVCIIGWDIIEQLFAGVDPLGREIRVGGDSFLIVGLGKKIGSVLGQSRDNWVMIPLTTYQKGYGTRQSLTIWGKSGGAEHLAVTTDEVRQLMRGRRKLDYFAEDDFAIETHDSFLAVWGNVSATFFYAVAGIASVALIVGGIVIMNIMLVSVTERTNEIGLRKSLGARRSDIRMQFLIESSTIATIGGICGIVLGILLAKFVSWVTPLPSGIEPWSIIAGLLVATSVGLFFGIYPATKAARLDPVEALRTE